MSEILARVTPRTLDVPRGVDALHCIRVPRDWLECGAVLELRLPRNLACAACGGGGCDSCQRSGAATLRGRGEPPEIVSVTLPARSAELSDVLRGVVIRIPEQGGLPPAREPPLPRGLLFLRVEPGEVADAGVSRVGPPQRPLARRVALLIHSILAHASRRRSVGWWIVLSLLGALACLRLLALCWPRGLGSAP